MDRIFKHTINAFTCRQIMILTIILIYYMYIETRIMNLKGVKKLILRKVVNNFDFFFKKKYIDGEFKEYFNTLQ